MLKPITIRLKDEKHALLKKFAEMENRSISDALYAEALRLARQFDQDGNKTML